MDIKTGSYYNSYFSTKNTHSSKIRQNATTTLKKERLMGTTEERPRTKKSSIK